MSGHTGERSAVPHAYRANVEQCAPVLASSRLTCGVLVMCTALVLGLSFGLAPSPDGWGTHQRLWLPPCMFHTLTGLPCPFCGMTTAFTLMSRGKLGAAFAAHPLGPLLYAATWVVLALSVWGLVTGRFPFPHWVLSWRFSRAVLMGILAAWVVMIIRRLA